MRSYSLAFKIDTYIRCKGWEVRETRVYCWPLIRVRNDQKAKRFTLILKTDITRTIGEQSSIHRTLPFIIDHWFTSTCVKSQNALCKLTRTLNPTLACKKSKVKYASRYRYHSECKRDICTYTEILGGLFKAIFTYRWRKCWRLNAKRFLKAKCTIY